MQFVLHNKAQTSDGGTKLILYMATIKSDNPNRLLMFISESKESEDRESKYVETKVLDLSHPTRRIMLAPGAEVRQRSMVNACFLFFHSGPTWLRPYKQRGGETPATFRSWLTRRRTTCHGADRTPHVHAPGLTNIFLGSRPPICGSSPLWLNARSAAQSSAAESGADRGAVGPGFVVSS